MQKAGKMTHPSILPFNAEAHAALKRETPIPHSKLHSMPPIGQKDEGGGDEEGYAHERKNDHKRRHLAIAARKKARAQGLPSGSNTRLELLYAAQLHMSVANSGLLNPHGVMRMPMAPQ